MNSLKWPLRLFALIVGIVGFTTPANAQNRGPLRPDLPGQPPKAPPLVIYPQFNTLPGIPANQLQRPLFNPGPFYNPALNNPWMNQTRIVPYNPFVTPVYGPFAPNPFNPLTPVVGPSPFAPNPYLFNNPYLSPFNNPFAPVYGPGTFATSTPPIAIQQPGQLMYRGPDLQVNPVSGLVYKPVSGVAQTADGSVFYRVAGTGLPTIGGKYSPGSGLYFNPQAGTFLNPSTGVISQPGQTTVFMPYIR
jgi:hypothetical protein